MDVYEREGPLFFRDLSSLKRTDRLKYWDEAMATLNAMPNVLACAFAPRPPGRGGAPPRMPRAPVAPPP